MNIRELIREMIREELDYWYNPEEEEERANRRWDRHQELSQDAKRGNTYAKRALRHFNRNTQGTSHSVDPNDHVSDYNPYDDYMDEVLNKLRETTVYKNKCS